MSPTVKDLLTDEVRDLPTSPIPVDAVVRDGHRRLWRHRATGGTAAFAAVAVLGALVVQAAPNGDGDGGFAGTVDRSAATYSTGSTIHDGDQEIDVSPHEVASFVQTDDGFVFVDQDSDVYFADGATVEQIGDGNGTWTLAADDAGSYVGWVDYGDSPPDYVIYDTSTRSEVMRRTDEDGEPLGSGEHTSFVQDIDGDIAYLRDSKGFVAWNLIDGTSERLASDVDPSWLLGVADGRLAHVESEGDRRYVVVSEDPHADHPRVPFDAEAVGAELSPMGKYVVTRAPETGDLVVTEVASQRDVTPDGIGYLAGLAPMHWIDDDSFSIAWTPPGSERPDISLCSISAGECRVVVESVARTWELRGPNGEDEPLT
jgi:hypothetical protein